MIIIAPDKFRGTLDANEATSVIASALHEACPAAETVSCPMADGGEGTAQVLFHGMPFRRTATGVYAGADGSYAVVSAEVIGHQYASASGLTAMQRSSYGLGAAIARIIADRPQSSSPIFVCIGGTSTVDAGAGMLQALGASFLDNCKMKVPIPVSASDLPKITHADMDGIDLPVLRKRIIGLCDVKASLVGHERISALDFAAQKGVSDSEMPLLERSLAHFRRLFGQASSQYDGAGGGTGFALAAVIGAECKDGASFLLSRAISSETDVSAFITGEGRIDNQTMAGKVVSAVFSEAEKRNVPAFAFGGMVDQSCHDRRYFSTMRHGDAPPSDRSQAASRLRQAVLDHAGQIFEAIESHRKNDK